MLWSLKSDFKTDKKLQEKNRLRSGAIAAAFSSGAA
jgi:hypothetical protein